MKPLPDLAKDGILTKSFWNQVKNTINANFREVTLQPGVGYTITNSPGGQSMMIKAGGSSVAKKPPFSIISSKSSTGNDQITLTPGVVGGFLPSNLMTPVTVDLTASVYVSLDVTSVSGAITGVSVGVGTVNFTGQTPVAYAPAGNFQIPAGVIIDEKPWNLLAKNWVNPIPVVAYTTYEGETNTPVPYYIWTW